MALSVRKLLEVLEAEYGDPQWWPGDSPFEIAVSAILTQRTSWRNAELAIRNLKSAGLLTPKSMAGAERSRLSNAIRPSGFHSQKSRYIQEFARFLCGRYRGDLDAMRARPLDEVRLELDSLPGVGPETADSILLYALRMPSFVVDAYTFRLIDRLPLDLGDKYEDVKRSFERGLELDIDRLSRMHALIVVHCKERCRMRPDCRSCPLGSFCKSKLKDKQQQVSSERSEQRGR